MITARKLKQFYFDPAHVAGFTGKQRLIDAVHGKIGKEDVEAWIDKQSTYNKHRRTTRNFTQRMYTVDNIDSLWECDLMDMRFLKDYNDGYTFLLVVIDVFSKQAWIEPLKDKSGKAVVRAFREIFKKCSPRFPAQIQSDRGKEFLNSDFQIFLRKKGVQFRTARNPVTKAAVAERFLLTIKTRIWRYFTHTRQKRYIDVLQKFVDSYNRAYHRSIRTAPVLVTIDNAEKVRQILRERQGRIARLKPKYSERALVRISTEKVSFQKGYQSKWSDEVFYISRILDNRYPVVYEIADLNDEVVDGIFYEQELSSVGAKKPEHPLQINKILDARGRGRGKRILVNWKQLPSDFVSWIPAQ